MTLSALRDGRSAGVLAEAAARARAAAARERLWARGGIAVLGVALLLFWEYGLGLIVERRYVSSPSEVAARLAELVLDGRLWGHIGVTLTEAGTGYLIGIAVGLGAALLLVAVPVLDEIVGPFLAAFYSIPKIALAPMFIMWFGLGLLPKILLAALMVFLIVLANTMAGVRGIDPGLIQVARVMGARGARLVRTIVLPGAAPAVVASVRLTFSRAMVGAILGEFIAATQGLGFLIVRSSRQFETATVFAGIAVVAVLVMVVNAAIRALEARALPWSAERPHG
ncbi:ABC transporter permease [Nonomuraea turcica]|uniref:ABC transporter permease n=1 Tax=Nonomuraea sp. G32 TaxID=3067274 RepID=UPI00273B3419|nr:ABC transporter permease [Nonomuraea sp. G32]MDP4510994.1 ABC transporter permease [Nonomuraea sp. G32]